jgi:hypothetical protein
MENRCVVVYLKFYDTLSTAELRQLQHVLRSFHVSNHQPATQTFTAIEDVKKLECCRLAKKWQAKIRLGQKKIYKL